MYEKLRAPYRERFASPRIPQGSHDDPPGIPQGSPGILQASGLLLGCPPDPSGSPTIPQVSPASFLNCFGIHSSSQTKKMAHTDDR